MNKNFGAHFIRALLWAVVGCGNGEPQSSESVSSAPSAAPEESVSQRVSRLDPIFEALRRTVRQFSGHAKWRRPPGLVIR